MEALRHLLTGAGPNAIEGPGVYSTRPHHLVMVTPSYLLALAARFRQADAPSLGSRNSTPAASKAHFTKSALHLPFLLVRLGGVAADYFRGHPSALRAVGLSGARCGGFGEPDARLITIGELDAGRLECTL
jgi:hypothetical protein